MKARVKFVLTQLLVVLLSMSVAFPQESMPVPQQSTAVPNRPTVTQQELDQMLAPIALYPDALLSQILMASTYPLEVIQAARWSKANPTLKGDEAVKAVDGNNWEPSVKSLVAFPQILTMMDENLNWMERLGDAFLAQEAQVMDTVQHLRQKAYEAGNLKSSNEVRVEQQGQTIVVESPNPQVIYVPYYDPRVVYGPWWWPAYPPVYWGPWPGYYVSPGFGAGFVWGVGITLGVGFFFGAFDWPHRHVNIVTVNNYYYRNNVVRVWEHDPVHRRGVPYRNVVLRQQYGRTSAFPEARRDFRGHDRPVLEGRREFGNHLDAPRGPVRRPEERSRPGVPGDRPITGSTPSRSNVPDAGRSDLRSIPSRPSVSNEGNRPVEQRPHVFEGVGRGADARNSSARGHASSQQGQHRGGGQGGGGQQGGGGHR